MSDNKNVNINGIASANTDNASAVLLNKAILTHYLHNMGTEWADAYQNAAIEIVEEFIASAKLKKSNDQIFSKIGEELKSATFPCPEKPSFTFIDLFAGLGGFRLAMQSLGGKCVFSSEWDANAQITYQTNFGEMPFGDITTPETKSFIPDQFDLLCAGFPCQPFSKGGFQNGFEDTRGTLFFDICEIVKKHKPKYMLLENVQNLASHDNGNTYKVIARSLANLGYCFPEKPMIISPDRFGIPILRPRIYIPCVRKDLVRGKEQIIRNFADEIGKSFSKGALSIDHIIDPTISDSITPYEERVLEMWDEFHKGIDLKVVGFPVWMEYFKYDGSLDGFPKWKASFISKNMELYRRNRAFIDRWLKKYDNLDWCVKTHRKMEWQAGEEYASVFECLIQFRPSGVRIKKPNKFSTLVAMNHRQIIGKLKRRISIEESKLLQSFPKEYRLVGASNIVLKQLGNSVNVTVLQNVFKLLLEVVGK